LPCPERKDEVRQIEPSCGWCDGRNLGAGLGALTALTAILLLALSVPPYLAFLAAGAVLVVSGLLAVIIVELAHDCGPPETVRHDPPKAKAFFRRRR
jgi:hypothetical protein